MACERCKGYNVLYALPVNLLIFLLLLPPGGSAASAQPLVSNISAYPLLTTAAITWATDSPGTSQVEYGLTQSLGALTPSNATPTRLHTIKLTGLIQGSVYFYRVMSKNSAGTVTAPEEAPGVFTTLKPLIDAAALTVYDDA